MKIFVIFTGGTIGSRMENGWTDVNPATQYTLLQKHQNMPDISFTTCAPYSLLSENLSATELNLLQENLQQVIDKDYAGIIVTHGTDTLQYTAAAMDYAFCGSKIPIVFVSADYPLEDPRSNGFANFAAAVDFIKTATTGGVYVAYKNRNAAEAAIHIGSRLLQHQEYAADIYSLQGPVTATAGIGPVEYVANPGILSIDSYPGNDYRYRLDAVNAIILKPYHSGTLDTANLRFQEFCRRATKKNIPLFIANANPDVAYKSTALYAQLGIRALPFCTYTAAYMKLWVAISLGKNIPDFMSAPVANEYP